MTLVNLTSGGSLELKIGCFEGAQIVDVNLKSVKNIDTVQDSFKNVTNFDKLTIETGTFEAKYDSFLNSHVQEVFIRTGETTTFIQHVFKNTPNLRNLTIISDGNIDFQNECFIKSNVNNIELYTNGTVRFVQHSFKNTQNLTNLTIYSKAFLNCTNLTTLTIHSPSDVKFGGESFLYSQIQELSVTWENGTNGVIYLATPSTITFESDSFKNCNELTKVNVVNEDGNVDIKSNSFQVSKSLSKLNV